MAAREAGSMLMVNKINNFTIYNIKDCDLEMKGFNTGRL
jgi:hypothetical protein